MKKACMMVAIFAIALCGCPGEDGSSFEWPVEPDYVTSVSTRSVWYGVIPETEDGVYLDVGMDAENPAIVQVWVWECAGASNQWRQIIYNVTVEGLVHFGPRECWGHDYMVTVIR